jgi:hypothetical protein
MPSGCADFGHLRPGGTVSGLSPPSSQRGLEQRSIDLSDGCSRGATSVVAVPTNVAWRAPLCIKYWKGKAWLSSLVVIGRMEGQDAPTPGRPPVMEIRREP